MRESVVRRPMDHVKVKFYYEIVIIFTVLPRSTLEIAFARKITKLKSKLEHIYYK